MKKADINLDFINDQSIIFGGLTQVIVIKSRHMPSQYINSRLYCKNRNQYKCDLVNNRKQQMKK